MQVIDYHLHTPLCGHAAGQLHQYVETALERELGEIGFADHFPIFHLPPDDPRRSEYAMSFDSLPEYVWRVMELRLDYPEIKIRLGVEVDYIPGYEDQLASWLAAYPFDYVIGSVHFIDDWSFDDPRYVQRYADWSPDELWTVYFQRVQAAARSGLFDIIGHLDVIKKLGQPAPGPEVRRRLYRETVEVLAASGVCVEINSSGLRAPAREIYPARELLQLCREYGVPIVLGSDAHRPEEVGRELVLAARLAQKTGYDTMTTFEDREPGFRYF